MNRSRKAILCIISQLIYQIVATICGFITPRLILSSFGSSYNGIISSATKFLDMISILTLGIAGATRVEMYKPLADNDTLELSKIVKASNLYMKKVGYCIIIYAGILMITYPLFSNTDIPWYESILLIAIISLGSFIQYYFGVTYFTLLQADQSQFIVSTTRIFVSILNTLCVYLLIYSNNSIFTVKLFSLLIYAITPIIINIYAKKHYNLIYDCDSNTNFLKQRSSVAYHSIANIVHDQIDILLLTIFMDIKIVSVYAVYSLVINGLRSMGNIFTNGIEAGLANLWVKNEKDKFKKYFNAYETFICSYISIIYTCCWVLYIPFITLYSKNISDINYVLPVYAILLTISEIIYTLRLPYKAVVQAVGAYESTKKDALYEALINVILSLILIKPYGLIGVAIGTIVANLYRTFQYSLYSNIKIINRNIFPSLKKMIWMSISISISLIVNNNILKEFIITNWYDWFIKALIAFIINFIIILIFILLFFYKDFLFFGQFLLNAIKRKKRTSIC